MKTLEIYPGLSYLEDNAIVYVLFFLQLQDNLQQHLASNSWAGDLYRDLL